MNNCMTQEDASKMDNEQAIQILKPLRDTMIDQHGCPISSAVFALDKAIEVLSAQQEVTEEEVKEYCRKRCLSIIDSALLKKYVSAQPERCSDCIAHGGDWECDHIHCRKGRLPSAQPEQRWIPVSERLPEPRVDVWVNSDIGQIQGYYEEHINVWYASFGQGRDYLELIVNAWRPLPEPYGGEQG